MKYAVEMGSDTTINIPEFHKDWFRYSKMMGGFTDLICLLSFLQNKQSRLKQGDE
jgi:hypothetical protein